jgi:uncharacterized protein YcsI (UPF0317 family)
VISISEPGSPHIPALGSDLHIRSDLPRYRLWQNGEFAEEPADIHHLWREDLVAMWRTSIPTNAAGPF